MITRRAVLAAPVAIAAGMTTLRAEAQSPPPSGLEAALALEHEAVHTVPEIGARLDDAAKELAREIDAHHRLQRDRLAAALREAKRTPPVALTAYALPRPVVDRASAFDVLVIIEESLMRAYAEAVESEPPVHQRLAAELLARCATHVTSLRVAWRGSLSDVTQPFPSR